MSYEVTPISFSITPLKNRSGAKREIRLNCGKRLYRLVDELMAGEAGKRAIPLPMHGARLWDVSRPISI